MLPLLNNPGLVSREQISFDFLELMEESRGIQGAIGELSVTLWLESLMSDNSKRWKEPSLHSHQREPHLFSC